ncbi:hypothetical protein, partial [Escherichia coli]|uniref:hypothetical protein n=1 Tax=Escherichia coli TaxID=562 RepID=UPI003D36AF74
ADTDGVLAGRGERIAHSDVDQPIIASVLGRDAQSIIALGRDIVHRDRHVMDVGETSSAEGGERGTDGR